MHVEVSKFIATESPASVVSESVVEDLASLMSMVGGINSITITKYVAGVGSGLYTTISQFQDAPQSIKTQGLLIKDSVAQIMSVANVSRITIIPNDDDIKSFEQSWKNADDQASKTNGSSIF